MKQERKQMKTRQIISLILAVLFCVGATALTSCGEKNPSGTDTTTAAQTPSGTTAGPDDSTAAPADTTEAPADTTAAVVTTAAVTTEAEEEFDFDLNEYGTLEADQKAKLLEKLPALLPDGTPIEDFVRPYCLDDVLDKDGFLTHYYTEGNSGATVQIVTEEEGAIFGTAYRFAAYGKTAGGDRGEITVISYYEANPKGAKGIIFYVDYSHVADNPEKPLCASVTFNNNTYRANKSDNGSIGYYFQDGLWTETKNVNACRMEVPANFVGWIYIPATSFVLNSDKSPAVDEQGKFIDITVNNMRCYTDGYVYGSDDTTYIIFDEIIYIY